MSQPVIANHSGVVIGPGGQRLYGMDAELALKREAQRDTEFELQVAKWIEKAVGTSLADPSDLWVSLRSGVVLCELVNRVVPGTIKKYAKTNLLPLMEMDNIQLYLKACWNMGIPSGDFFIVSDLYHKKSMPQVIQNIVSLSRVAPSLGYDGEPLVAGNTGKDRVKNWETVAAGGPLKRIEELEAGTPAERITQLTVQLGEAKHALDASKSDNFNLHATIKELKSNHSSDRDRWEAEKQTLENRLKKFAPIDDGGEGAPGSMAVKALELHYQTEIQGHKRDLDAERKRYAALEAKFEELKQKQSQTALDLSRLKQQEKKAGVPGASVPTPMGGSAAVAASAEKPSWMAKLTQKKPGVRAPSVRIPTMTAETAAPTSAAFAARARPESVMLSEGEQEGSNYRLSVMLQLKASDGSADNRKTGFFFSADDLGAEGVEYLSEQLDLLFANTPIDQDASTILNEMLLADSGRRTFTFALKEKLRALNFQKVQLDAGPFLTLLSLVNSALTGMQLEKQIDYIAMTFLLGASRAVFTTGSKSQMEEFIADHLRDHSIWNDIRFWEQHFWDVIGKAFKKKFARLSLGKAQQAGWADEQSKFLSQFVASFAHEMGRWSLSEASMKEFFELVFERLVLAPKYQTATRAYYDKLVSRQVAKQLQDTAKLKHVSMVMTSSQAQRLAGAGAGKGGSSSSLVSSSSSSSSGESDANILQGWLKRKVHIMWITEWVSQSGTTLNFREFKQSSTKRIVVNLDKLVKVDIRSDAQLGRTIFVEAGDMKLTLAPVKDTDEEINYWVNGLKKMQGRFNAVPGTIRSSPMVPKKSAEVLQKQQQVAASATAAMPSASLPLPTPTITASQPTAVLDSSVGNINSSNNNSNSSSSSSPVKSPTFSRLGASGAIPGSPSSGTSSARTSLFGVAVASLEGWMQLNVTKEISKKFKGGLKTGWSPLWFSQEGSKLAVYRTQQKDDEQLGVIDLMEITQMESTTHEDVSGDVIRLLTKTMVFMVCPQNAEMYDYWLKGLTACRKRFLNKQPSSSELLVPGSSTTAAANASATNASSPPASSSPSEGSGFVMGRQRGKTNMEARLSTNAVGDQGPSSRGRTSTATLQKDSSGTEEKLEGWMQFKGAAIGAVKSSKGLLGTLKKLTASKWTPFWFTLTSGTLYVFKSQDDTTCLGDLDLESVVNVEETTDKEMVGRVIRLNMNSGDSNFLCPKENDFAAWWDRIHGSVLARQRSSATGSNTSSSNLLAAPSPSLSRNNLFSRAGRSSTVNRSSNSAIVIDRAVPTPEESLSGWAHVEEGKKWQRYWLAQKGTILTLFLSPEDEQSRGQYDLVILTKFEAVTGPDAYGPAIMCWFGEYNILLFSPERGQHAYWMAGLGFVADKYTIKFGSKPLSAVSLPSSTPSKSSAPLVFKTGAAVWAQFTQDLLWYRATIDEGREGDIYDVTFSEYRNQQKDCTLSMLRAIDDPAMLALLGSTAEQVTAPSSVDRNRPMSVQLPSNIAAALKKANSIHTYFAIDPSFALREQAAENGEEDPSSKTGKVSRKVVDAMYEQVLKDDEDEDTPETAAAAAAEEARVEEEKRRQADLRKEKLRQAKEAKEAKERVAREEEEERLKRQKKEEEEAAAKQRKKEEEARQREEEERRLQEEEERTLREEEERIRKADEEERQRLERREQEMEEERRQVEREKKRREDEEREKEEKLRRQKEEEATRRAAEAAAAAAERKRKEEEELKRASDRREAELLKRNSDRKEAEAPKSPTFGSRVAVATPKEPSSPRSPRISPRIAELSAQMDVKKREEEEAAKKKAEEPQSRSAAVQAALARAKARTAAVTTSSDAPAGPPRKPLPDPHAGGDK